jgi:hypothetical protein
MVAAKMGGQDPRHLLSAGHGATASDSNGVPFNGSWVIASETSLVRGRRKIDRPRTFFSFPTLRGRVTTP